MIFLRGFVNIFDIHEYCECEYVSLACEVLRSISLIVDFGWCCLWIYALRWSDHVLLSYTVFLCLFFCLCECAFTFFFFFLK